MSWTTDADGVVERAIENFRSAFSVAALENLFRRPLHCMRCARSLCYAELSRRSALKPESGERVECFVSFALKSR